MLKKWIVTSSLVLLMLSACQNNQAADDNDTAYDLRNDPAAPNIMTNRTGDRQHYVEDDITDQNPNFLNLNRSGDQREFDGTNNNGTDIEKARQIIGETDEFVADSVWVNGDRMWVSVYKRGMLADRERIDAESRLHRKLVKALPRYNIEVRVKEDRR